MRTLEDNRPASLNGIDCQARISYLYVINSSYPTLLALQMVAKDQGNMQVLLDKRTKNTRQPHLNYVTWHVIPL